MHICMNQLTQERTNQHEIQNQRHPLSIYLHPRSVATFHLRMVGSNRIVGLFSAVNESTWEHLKLLFFPMLLLALIELFFFHEKMPANYLWARTLGILSGMIFIVAVFYTLNGILGKNYDWINIVLYFAGVIFALFVENDVYRNGKAENLILSSAILLLLTAAFFTFTEYPPQLGIFREI